MCGVQSTGCGMSLENKDLDDVLVVLAASPAAYERLVQAFESVLVDERATADSYARAALLSPSDSPQACVRLGRVQMLEGLIGHMNFRKK